MLTCFVRGPFCGGLIVAIGILSFGVFVCEEVGRPINKGNRKCKDVKCSVALFDATVKRPYDDGSAFLSYVVDDNISVFGIALSERKDLWEGQVRGKPKRSLFYKNHVDHGHFKKFLQEAVDGDIPIFVVNFDGTVLKEETAKISFASMLADLLIADDSANNRASNIGENTEAVHSVHEASADREARRKADSAPSVNGAVAKSELQMDEKSALFPEIPLPARPVALKNFNDVKLPPAVSDDEEMSKQVADVSLRFGAPNEQDKLRQTKEINDTMTGAMAEQSHQTLPPAQASPNVIESTVQANKSGENSRENVSFTSNTTVAADLPTSTSNDSLDEAKGVPAATSSPIGDEKIVAPPGTNSSDAILSTTAMPLHDGPSLSPKPQDADNTKSVKSVAAEGKTEELKPSAVVESASVESTLQNAKAAVASTATIEPPAVKPLQETRPPAPGSASPDQPSKSEIAAEPYVKVASDRATKAAFQDSPPKLNNAGPSSDSLDASSKPQPTPASETPRLSPSSADILNNLLSSDLQTARVPPVLPEAVQQPAVRATTTPALMEQPVLTTTLSPDPAFAQKIEIAPDAPTEPSLSSAHSSSSSSSDSPTHSHSHHGHGHSHDHGHSHTHVGFGRHQFKLADSKADRLEGSASAPSLPSQQQHTQTAIPEHAQVVPAAQKTGSDVKAHEPPITISKDHLGQKYCEKDSMDCGSVSSTNVLRKENAPSDLSSKEERIPDSSSGDSPVHSVLSKVEELPSQVRATGVRTAESSIVGDNVINVQVNSDAQQQQPSTETSSSLEKLKLFSDTVGRFLKSLFRFIHSALQLIRRALPVSYQSAITESDIFAVLLFVLAFVLYVLAGVSSTNSQRVYSDKLFRFSELTTKLKLLQVELDNQKVSSANESQTACKLKQESEAKAKIAEELQQLQDQFSALSNELQKLRNENRSLAEHNAQVQASLDGLAVERSTLSADCSSAKEANADLTTKLHALEVVSQDSLKKVESLVAQLADKETELRKASAEAANANARLSALQEQCSSAAAEKGDLERKTAQLVADIREKDKTIETLNSVIASSMDDVGERSSPATSSQDEHSNGWEDAGAWETDEKQQAASDVVKQRKMRDRLEQIVDAAKVREQLAAVELERNRLQQLLEAESARAVKAEQDGHRLKVQLDTLQDDAAKSSKRALEAQTKQQIICDHYKEREEELSKKLGVFEAEASKQENAIETREKELITLREEVALYKERTGELQKQLEADDKKHRDELQKVQTELFDYWKARRQAEKQLEEIARERDMWRMRCSSESRLLRSSNSTTGADLLPGAIASLANSNSSEFDLAGALPPNVASASLNSFLPSGVSDYFDMPFLAGAPPPVTDFPAAFIPSFYSPPMAEFERGYGRASGRSGKSRGGGKRFSSRSPSPSEGPVPMSGSGRPRSSRSEQDPRDREFDFEFSDRSDRDERRLREHERSRRYEMEPSQRHRSRSRGKPPVASHSDSHSRDYNSEDSFASPPPPQLISAVAPPPGVRNPNAHRERDYRYSSNVAARSDSSVDVDSPPELTSKRKDDRLYVKPRV